MLGVTNPWTYVLGTVAIILLPGPNSLYVLSVAGRRGVRDGYVAAAGVWLGDAILMTLSACGVASLLHTYPWLFAVVKYAGAGYLGYVGIRLVLDTVRRTRGTPGSTVAEVVMADERPADRPFRRALVISVLNPKAILFFISFFIQFVDPAYAYPAVSFVILGVIAELISLAYLTALIFTGRYLAEQFRSRRRLSAWLTGLVGGVFVAFGVKLATASLS
jgi:leucine efflux protein